LNSIIRSKLLLIEWENKKDWIQAIEYFKRYKDQKIDLRWNQGESLADNTMNIAIPKTIRRFYFIYN